MGCQGLKLFHVKHCWVDIWERAYKKAAVNCRLKFVEKSFRQTSGPLRRGLWPRPPSLDLRSIHLVRFAQRGSGLQPIKLRYSLAFSGKLCIGAVDQIKDLDSTAKVGAHRPPFTLFPRRFAEQISPLSTD